MKQLILRFILPVTIVSFFLFTKWWYALPVDAPDKLYWGFPLAYVGEGFHTSLSLQFFAIEWVVDVSVYFLLWLAIFFLLKRLRPQFFIKKGVSVLVWSIAVVFLMGAGLVVWLSNPVFHLKRPYEWRVMETGYTFIWQQTPRPDIRNYHSGFTHEEKHPAKK